MTGEEVDTNAGYPCKSPYILYRSTDQEGLSIRPGPGVCCPEMHFVDGICTGCGCVLNAVCQRRIDRACCFVVEGASKGCIGRLDCEGYEGLLNPKFMNSDLSRREYRKAIWEQKLHMRELGFDTDDMAMQEAQRVSRGDIESLGVAEDLRKKIWPEGLRDGMNPEEFGRHRSRFLHSFYPQLTRQWWWRFAEQGQCWLCHGRGYYYEDVVGEKYYVVQPYPDHPEESIPFKRVKKLCHACRVPRMLSRFAVRITIEKGELDPRSLKGISGHKYSYWKRKGKGPVNWNYDNVMEFLENIGRHTMLMKLRELDRKRKLTEDDIRYGMHS